MKGQKEYHGVFSQFSSCEPSPKTSERPLFGKKVTIPFSPPLHEPGTSASALQRASRMPETQHSPPTTQRSLPETSPPSFDRAWGHTFKMTVCRLLLSTGRSGAKSLRRPLRREASFRLTERRTSERSAFRPRRYDGFPLSFSPRARDQRQKNPDTGARCPRLMTSAHWFSASARVLTGSSVRNVRSRYRKRPSTMVCTTFSRVA